MGSVILVSSQKNEIGKTIISIKTGVELSKSGKKVLLMDLSSGKKKISEYLNVNEDIIYDIKDVLDCTCSVEQAIIDITENLSILPYPRIFDKLNKVKRENFSKLIIAAKNKYDIIIVDIDKTIELSFVDFNNIDIIVSVNNNDYSSVKEINNDIDIANKFSLDSSMVVINRYDKKKSKKGIMLKISDLKKMIEKELTAIIEEDSRYVTLSNDFFFNKEENIFNDGIKEIINKINSIV
ncbi:nucleotide-binding protein [Sedimentibacter sp. MB31-C6]|uniref:nucleotide-binding protein n=1 Tax=Sedimentibacter sp. MB31-C6 TaxID=3109366 RepID=UPI002DDD8305|nr:AAA family ATPase [Sedimentibacter sp. MB36-C1]WSI04381.1 AAA family ATPase [Sedimentibacter sp. MB36-C1]